MKKDVRYAIGVDLGATDTKAVSVTPEGDVLEQRVAPTEDGPEPRWAELVGVQIRELEKNHGRPADWVGLCAPGYARPDGRLIAWMQGRMEAVQGLDWTEFLGGNRVVPVLNDAHAALLGEVWRGAAAGVRDAVLLTLGTGVGGAILSDGRLLKGHLGRAGHLGHIALDVRGRPDIVGTPGSLEDAIGDCSLSERSGGRFRRGDELVEAYRRGDLVATRVWLDSLHALACGVASIVNALDPEVVILGGGNARLGDDLFRPLATFLEDVEWRPTGSGVRVVPAALGEGGGAIGAARFAMDPSLGR